MFQKKGRKERLKSNLMKNNTMCQINKRNMMKHLGNIRSIIKIRKNGMDKNVYKESKFF